MHNAKDAAGDVNHAAQFTHMVCYESEDMRPISEQQQVVPAGHPSSAR